MFWGETEFSMRRQLNKRGKESQNHGVSKPRDTTKDIEQIKREG